MTASRDATTAELLSTRRQLELLRDLQRLANERSREEERIRTDLADGLDAAENDREAAAAAVERRFTAERAQATADFEQATGKARRIYEETSSAAQREYQGLRQGVESELSRAKDVARAQREQASFEALTVFDAVKGLPRKPFLEIARKLDHSNQELAVLEHDAIEIMKMRRQWRDSLAVVDERAGSSSIPANGAPSSTADAIQRADQWTSAVRDATVALQRQKLPRFYAGGVPFGVFFLIWLIAAVPCALLLDWQIWQWVAASLVAAALATTGLLAWMWPVARRHSGRQFQTIQQLLADARQALQHALAEARESSRREAQILVSERDRQLTTVEQQVHAMVGERERWKESEIGRAGQTFPQRLAQLRSELDSTLHAAKQKHVEALAQVTDDRDRGEAESRNEYARRCRELRATHDREWTAMADRWNNGLAEFQSVWDGMRLVCDRLFPDWNATNYDKMGKAN